MSDFAYVLSTVTPVSSSELRSILGKIQLDGAEYWAVGDRNNFLHTFTFNPQTKCFKRANTFEAHDGWISGFAFMKPCSQFPEGGLISCSHDHTVKVWAPQSLTELNMTGNTPVWTMTHDAQVCFVSTTDDGRIISCGWDSTCRIWKSPQDCLILRHEQYAIWSATQIPNGFITCGADKSIRIWSTTGELKYKLDNAHNDVIRASLYIPSRNIVATASNDGTIVEWRLNGLSLSKVGTITVSDQYLYSLSLLDDFTYVVSSEDRCAYVASAHTLMVADVLPLPDVVWSVDVLSNNDIICASADGCVRSFTMNQERRCDKETEENYLGRLSSLTFSNPEFQQINPLDLPDISSLSPENARAGGGTLVRNGKEMVVCTWSNGYHRWLQIGTVVISTDGSQKNKVADEEGNVWDYCFQVQLEDGREYPLYLNHDTNEYTAAYDFMAKHNLDSHSYLMEIVEFIQKNRKKTTIDTSTKPSFFPMRTPNFYTEINTEPIINKLRSLNNNDPIVSDEQFRALQGPISSQLFNILEEVVLKWPHDQSWPILDILRARITDPSARQFIPADRLCNLVTHVSHAQNPPEFLILMLMRVIGNMFQNYSAEAMSNINIIYIFNNFAIRYHSLTPRTQAAYATAVLNYSTFLQGNSAASEALMDILIEFFSSVMDESALHRLIYAAGNVASYSAGARNKIQLHPEVIEIARSKQLSPDVSQALTALIDLIS
ncbi:phospholipase A2 activator protein [Tritrichomonas foetus]|uniref:Phospholipase A2 activator protein n=1 Tax=Tritrichomonas foetus TaxID=1144522 RepID=A0A1J4KXP9_9EUKA|nr:phospholipase A2 activator protein [Tritrichomonas foetus]|eukprot:OHT14476.1 phospholipase A2 activator protein [Tritrichomonas foetus]